MINDQPLSTLVRILLSYSAINFYPAYFSNFSLSYNRQENVQWYVDGNWTVDLWCWTRLLYQLSLSTKPFSYIQCPVLPMQQLYWLCAWCLLGRLWLEPTLGSVRGADMISLSSPICWQFYFQTQAQWNCSVFKNENYYHGLVSYAHALQSERQFTKQGRTFKGQTADELARPFHAQSRALPLTPIHLNQLWTEARASSFHSSSHPSYLHLSFELSDWLSSKRCTVVVAGHL